ncbi:MAG: YdcF family protein [Nitrospiraceae bacterium]|nr:YdcF family protein [Nitrospiraceae bacterium]
MFIITRLLQILLTPPSIILAILFAGFWLSRRNPQAGRALLVLGTVFLYLASVPSVADLLIKPLESAYPPFHDTGTLHADAVVSLGGGVRDLSWVPAGPVPSSNALERVVAAAVIARKLDIPLLFSGGSGEITPGAVSEAAASTRLAEDLGIQPDRILIEDRSRNTLENAGETRRILKGTTIILVTSAFHMKRAVALFQREGFTVIPAPTGFRAETRPPSVRNILPSADSLATTATALSEYLNRAWYTLNGTI